jgi:hypothetical protein
MKIRFTKLLGTTYQTRCSACGALSKYTGFEASFYDFNTYLGEKTGTLYRLNVDRTDMKYGKITVEEALRPAVEHEGGRSNLRLVPDELRCQKCGQIGVTQIQEWGAGYEESVEAVELPLEE